MFGKHRNWVWVKWSLFCISIPVQVCRQRKGRSFGAVWVPGMVDDILNGLCIRDT